MSGAVVLQPIERIDQIPRIFLLKEFHRSFAIDGDIVERYEVLILDVDNDGTVFPIDRIPPPRPRPLTVLAQRVDRRLVDDRAGGNDTADPDHGHAQ